MGILANPIAVWILFVLLLSLFVGAFFAFIGRNGAFGVALVFLAILSGIGWGYATTHRVVPPNERWLIINMADGAIERPARDPGVTSKPFIMYRINKYPGVPEQPFCINYTPALKEGYEINAKVCGVYNAAKVDWVSQYSSHNFVNQDQMLAYWVEQTKESVSTALKEVNYTKITTDRASVSNSIREELYPWFNERGIQVSSLQLSNWTFTNPGIEEAVNQASAASMRTTIEVQLLEAAKKARERQLYEVVTANQVLEKRGEGLTLFLDSLGIQDDQSKAYLAAQMTWNTFAQSPPEGTQIILGIGGNPIAAPFSIDQPAPPTPAPTEVP